MRAQPALVGWGLGTREYLLRPLECASRAPRALHGYLRGAIVHVRASAYGPHVAALTDRGELLVYALHRSSVAAVLGAE